MDRPGSEPDHASDIATDADTTSVAAVRDEFIDFVRALSLTVVVLWHWSFTILDWREDGPHASNPIGLTNGLWVLTWFLQVMPLFFFIGGYAHKVTWRKIERNGGGAKEFIVGRAKRLAIPSFTVATVWIAAGVVMVLLGSDEKWVTRSILLVLSPLWFICVYLVLVCVAPFFLRAHKAWGPVVPVLLAGLAVLVDLMRFKGNVQYVSLLNLLFVFAFCHQLGFFYDRLIRSSRSVSWSLVVGGFIALIALTNMGLYPASMVGSPEDKFSNMGPPTVCIVALCCLQAGLATLLRPWIMRNLGRPRWAQANDIMNRFALPVFLFHMTGMAITLGIFRQIGYTPPSEPTLLWWAQRPIWIVVPFLCTLPVILIFGRRWIKWDYRRGGSAALLVRSDVAGDVARATSRVKR